MYERWPSSLHSAKLHWCGSDLSEVDTPNEEELIRVLFHLDNDRDYTCYLLMPGQQYLPTKKNLDGMVEAYLKPDEEAFGSGVRARDLLTADGITTLRQHLAEVGQKPESHVSVEFRVGGSGIAFPASVVKDVSANRWQDVA